MDKQKILTINNGNQQEYQWNDDIGFHQYYCDDVSIPTDNDTIHNFKYDTIVEGRIYSWTDNLGVHQYNCIYSNQ
jgi:hypothetical protein